MSTCEGFGRRLKARMKAVGLTQTELAQRVGINHSTVSIYITRDRIPYDDILDKITDELDISREELFSDKDGKTFFLQDKLVDALCICASCKTKFVKSHTALWKCCPVCVKRIERSSR